jgi:hypothetical protein
LRRVRFDLLIGSAERNLRSVPANADAHQTIRGRHSRRVEQVPAGTGGPLQSKTAWKSGGSKRQAYALT